jgi:hypothetical protein
MPSSYYRNEHFIHRRVVFAATNVQDIERVPPVLNDAKGVDASELSSCCLSTNCVCPQVIFFGTIRIEFRIEKGGARTGQIRSYDSAMNNLSYCKRDGLRATMARDTVVTLTEGALQNCVDADPDLVERTQERHVWAVHFEKNKNKASDFSIRYSARREGDETCGLSNSTTNSKKCAYTSWSYLPLKRSTWTTRLLHVFKTNFALHCKHHEEERCSLRLTKSF